MRLYFAICKRTFTYGRKKKARFQTRCNRLHRYYVSTKKANQCNPTGFRVFCESSRQQPWRFISTQHKCKDSNMPPKPIQDSGFYRALPQIARRPAPGEPGTLRQQLLAIGLYLTAQDDERRSGTQSQRLWTVCHCLATDRPIPIATTSSIGDLWK